MNKIPESIRLSILRCHLQNALIELELLGKLPRMGEQLEFMLDGVDEYVKGQKELENNND